MPITEKGLKKIKLVNREDKEVDVLLLRWPPEGVSQHLVALLCRVGVDGIILALPKAGMDEETLMAGQRAPPEDMVGPNTVVEVTMLGSEGPAPEELLLVEFNKTVLPFLEKKPARTKKVITGFVNGKDLMPDLVELEEEIEEWLEHGEVRQSDYVTAAEGLPPPPGNPGEAFNMEKLDEVLVALGRLQSQVDQIQKHPNLAAVPKPKARQSALKTTPARQPEEGEEADAEAILMEVREKLSRKPVRVPDEPGGETMKHQAKDLLEASGAMSGDLNLDDAMKITMLKLLKDMQQGKTSRKKKLPGLPNWEESSSNDEAQGWSSSSRGGRGIEAVEKLRAAMRNHPEAYQSRMEARMLKALEISEMEPGVPAQYIKTIPVGKARTAGYAIHGFAEVLRYMIEGKHKQARLHVLRMLAAFEQFTIDESWVVASRVCGSEEPPWGHWANQDQSALRRQYIYNRLSEATMIGALINELKEEEWLQKKRGGLGKGPGKGDAKDKEKGKDE